MPKAPRDNDSTTPKKRVSKGAAETDNGTKVVKEAKTAPKRAKAKEVVAIPSLEDRIRIRAYELYLQRGGQGGSPEQDWFQAAAEVYGESVA